MMKGGNTGALAFTAQLAYFKCSVAVLWVKGYAWPCGWVTQFILELELATHEEP
jgi:hypothetical protein